MKNTKFLEAEEIALEEVNNEFVSVTMAGEKYVFDKDTLYDISFRFASFLAYLEQKEEQEADQICADCSRTKVH